MGLIGLAPAALAQKWEFGGGVGGSFYPSRDVSNGSTTASAGIRTSIASGVWLGQNASGKWGGEIRYDYQMGDLSLERGSASATLTAQSHALHYDVLWHATRRGSKVRPFLAAGAGIKVYRATGQPGLVQPLSQYALLTQGNELKALLSVGAGREMADRKFAAAAPGSARLHHAFPQGIDCPQRGLDRPRHLAEYRTDAGNRLYVLTAGHSPRGANEIVCTLTQLR